MSAAVKTKPRVPELRFAEFEGVWEERRLGDVAEINRGKFSVRPRNDPRYFGGNIPFVQTGDVGNASRYLSTFSQTLNDEGLAVSRTFPEGAILITIAANIGDVAILSFPVACPDSLVGIVSSSATNNEFLFELLGKQKNLLNRYATTNAQANINLEVLRPLKIDIPSLPEQKKIASFLGAVDGKLEVLRGKHAALERFKRGLMQKLFSRTLRFTHQNGTPYPDWEEKRLGDLLTIRYGKDHKELPDGDIPVFGTGGVMRYVDRFIHSGPSVLIGRKGTIDRPRFATEPFWTVDTLFYSDINDNYVPYFAFLVAQSVNWLKYSEATGVPSLSASVIGNVRVTVTKNTEEQQKIADALSAMDAKITAVADQITRLETFKRGLLQKMFV